MPRSKGKNDVSKAGNKGRPKIVYPGYREFQGKLKAGRTVVGGPKKRGGKKRNKFTRSVG